eukprot:gene18963-biopygen9993
MANALPAPPARVIEREESGLSGRNGRERPGRARFFYS